MAELFLRQTLACICHLASDPLILLFDQDIHYPSVRCIFIRIRDKIRHDLFKG